MPKQVHITEHALVRYLERVRGFSFEKEKEELRKICGSIDNGTIKVHGHRFEIKNGSLITIVPPGVNATKRKEVHERLSGSK